MKEYYSTEKKLYPNDKCLVVDIDNTISITPRIDNKFDYTKSKPIKSMINKLNKMYAEGWHIIYFTSRNMLTYEGNLEKISSNMMPLLIDWLQNNNVQYNELRIGKPLAQWGFYVDDKAVRPKEFLENSIEELRTICKKDIVNE